MGALIVQYLHSVGNKIWILLSPTLLNIYQLILVKKTQVGRENAVCATEDELFFLAEKKEQ